MSARKKFGSNRKPIYSVILIGGIGSRLWPLSTSENPKPFWPLFSKRSLLVETMLRVRSEGFAPPMIIANADQQGLLRDALPPKSRDDIWQLFEPKGRNTAAAIAVAAQFALEQWGDVTLLILPSDHYIARPAQLRAVLRRAQRAAQSGGIITFGLVPTHAHTGLGYIQMGQRYRAGGRHIVRFREKPNATMAARWVASQQFVWNSGMFMAQASVFAEALATAQPRLSRGVARSLAQAKRRGKKLWLPMKPFAHVPALPFDIAVMETSKQGVVFPANFGWSDIGSWHALWNLLPKDKHGNVVQGQGVVLDGSDNYVRVQQGQPPVVLAGVEGLAVVQTPHATLIVRQDQDQLVKQAANLIARPTKRT